ncbi:MAG: hypothetical protein NTX82_03095 [Candidatus Parcubacteria bacterium]|nr:hypothetical protein [Candidatus Parcubacteria bacterium]
MPKFEVIKGEKDQEQDESMEDLRKELRELADKHSTHIGLHPQWCVYGAGPDMGAGVLYWIISRDGDKFIARQMSQIINKMGGQARVEMTEWNENRTTKPVYQQKGHLDYVLNNRGNEK